MRLNVGLHDPIKAHCTIFESSGEQCGSITFTAEDGSEVKIFTTPHVARRVAQSFKEAVEDEWIGAEGDPERISKGGEVSP